MNQLLSLSQNLSREVINSNKSASVSNFWEQRLFGQEGIELTQNYSLPGHQQLRCGCIACRSSQLFREPGQGVPRDLEPWEFAENGFDTKSIFEERISTTAPNVGFYSKSLSQIASLSLDRTI